MASPAQSVRGHGPRRSILDLSPLELDCMNALWSLGEGTVREIQDWLVAARPRAYTTIMTIMDRLAHKGVVAREKTGRAYLYRPNLSAEEARAHALDRVVTGFFQGSTDELVAHLAGDSGTEVSLQVRTALPKLVRVDAPRPPAAARPVRARNTRQNADAVESRPPTRMDESLL